MSRKSNVVKVPSVMVKIWRWLWWKVFPCWERYWMFLVELPVCKLPMIQSLMVANIPKVFLKGRCRSSLEESSQSENFPPRSHPPLLGRNFESIQTWSWAVMVEAVKWLLAQVIEQARMGALPIPLPINWELNYCIQAAYTAVVGYYLDDTFLPLKFV